MSCKVVGLTVIFLLFVCQNVNGSGILEIKLKRYTSDGKGSNGHCCDGKLFFCPSDCDHKFRICVDKEQGSDAMSDCKYGVYQTDPTYNQDNINAFGDNIGNKPNYFPFRFTNWLGVVKVKVEVEDYDDEFSHDHVETLIKTVRRAPTSPPHYSPVFIHARTRLEIDFRVACDGDYYSNNCSVYCKPQNDKDNGFYTCNQQSGAKICYGGWTGPSCRTDINECDANVCRNNGTCNNTDGSYACTCLEGYKGINCEISPVCISQPCKNNGNCTETMFLSYNCSCQIGYSGTSCEIKVDPCTCSPCMNGGTCSSDTSGNYTCSCTPAWIGASCHVPMPPISPITFKGVPTRITLLGSINSGNRGDLVEGLKNLSRDLGGVQDRIILVQVETTTLEIRPEVTITEVDFVVAVEDGKTVIDNNQIDAIFMNNNPEVINPYLPLPLYYTNEGVFDPSAIVGMRSQRSWVHDYWYVIVLIAMVCILVALVFGFLFIRRRRRNEIEKTQIINNDLEVRPENMAFENVLYHENNRANVDREQATTPTETPDSDETLPYRVTLPEEGAVGGTSLPENAYDTPKALSLYQDIDDIKKPDRATGPYLDMNGSSRRSVDNPYADFGKLAVSMKSVEENHYQDLDKIKEELESFSSDSEDDIDAIKASFA